MPKKFLFSTQLLTWFDTHGRKNLPWQKKITPYRVWVSEIMLQQTQVETVIPYFERFMQHFPSLASLAQADIDEVLHLWTGLGYYTRARNLHKCANAIANHYAGKFPSSVNELVQLPGIGASTAAAISSIAFEQADAILDGNVKRVLARFHAVPGWPGNSHVAKELWQHAQHHMPSNRCRDYTQAIMDLGATVCKRSKPLCERCPMNTRCQAYDEEAIDQYPGRKPKKKQPIKACQMLIIRNPLGEIALYKRPNQGIWGGLWSLPEIDIHENPESYVITQFGRLKGKPKPLTNEPIKHVFSHFTLMIHPVELQLAKHTGGVTEAGSFLWYNLDSPQKLGLAAPVKKLIHPLKKRDGSRP